MLTDAHLDVLRRAIANPARSDGIGEAFRLDLTMLLRHYESAQAENAAMREIVQFVAETRMIYENTGDTGLFRCPRCSHNLLSLAGESEEHARNRMPHFPDCPVTKARAILAETDQK